MAELAVAKFSIGVITARVSEIDGQCVAELSKSYQDGDEWHYTDMLNHSDILNAIKVLKRAEKYIAGKQQQ